MDKKWLLPGDRLFPYTTLNIDVMELRRIHKVASGVTKYKLGAKPGLTTAAPVYADCSGYVGWLLSKAGYTDVADRELFNRLGGRGTWHLYDFFNQQGLKKSDPLAATRHDNILRVAVGLAGWVGIGKIGHIVLIYNGVTIESSGGKGANSRPWTGKGWQSFYKVFVVSRPVPFQGVLGV